jgi:hypothetical protein
MTVQIVIPPFKELVLLYVKHDVEIPGRAAFAPCIAFSRNPQLRPDVHARGYFKFESFLSNDAAVTVAHRTAVLDDLSGTMALAAGSRNAEESLLETDLTVAIAGRARYGRSAFLAAGSTAFRTCFVARYLDLRCCSESSFFEGKVEIIAKVSTSLHARTTAPTAAEHVAKAEDVPENIAEVSEDTRIEAAETATRSTAYTRMAEAVIVGALLAIA